MKRITLFFAIVTTIYSFTNIKQYYCTAADENFFELLINLIGSIHKNNFENLEEISVYDLGFSKKQKSLLSKIQKVVIYEVERTNPQILEPILTSPNGRKVRGSFSWKPVIIKQSLEKFPYILYLDAGLCVMDNLEDLFSYIERKGYFFVSPGPYNIKDRITNYVVEQVIDKSFFHLKDFLLDENTLEISANLQGLSKKMLNNYVNPMYEFSKNIQLFHDDGSAKLGWGAGRHDQILFSILLHASSMKMFDQGYIQLEDGGDLSKKIYCHSIFNPEMMHIWISQAGKLYEGGFAKYIKFKKGKRNPFI